MSKIKTGISQTLMAKLLDRPRVIEMDAFRKAYDFLFPMPGDFREFLRAPQAEKQVEISKKILLQIVQTHNLSPPAPILWNLLEFEQAEKGRTDGGAYIAQDHFVHLTNLYLLGIYIFSYHSELHLRCSKSFNQLKRVFKKDEGVRAPFNNYEIFARTWSMFVLYHDLGYPLERIKPKERQARKQSLQPFSGLVECALEDLAIRTLTNMLVVQSTIVADDQATLDRLFLSFCSDDDFSLCKTPDRNIEKHWSIKANKSRKILKKDVDAIRREWAGARQLIDLRGYRLGSALSLVDDSNVCAVLEDRDSGTPLLMILSCNRADSIVIYLDSQEHLPYRVKRASRLTLFDSAFGRQDRFSPSMHWVYFCRDLPGRLDRLVENCLQETKGDYNALLDKFDLRDELSPEFESVGPGKTVAFSCFSQLSEHSLRRRLHDREGASSALEETLTIAQSSLASISSRLPTFLAESIETFLKENIREEEFYDLLFQEEVPSALSKILDKVNDGREWLVNRVDAELAPSIRSEIQYEKALRRVRKRIEEMLREALLRQSAEISNVGISGQRLDIESFSIGEAKSGLNPKIISDLDRKIERLGLPGFMALVEKYRPPFDKKGIGVIDHGIASAIIAATLATFYQECVSLLNQRTGSECELDFIRLAFMSCNEDMDHLLQFETEELFEEAIVAILLHNIYPEALPQEYKSYKTGANESPFAYLALLADGLQRWDRPRQLNQAYGGIRTQIYADSYDLEIRGNNLLLTVMGGQGQIKRELDLRESLRGYLKDVDKILHFTVSEY